MSDGSIIWNKMHPKREENVTSLDSKFISQTDCIRAAPCSIVMFSDSDPDDYQHVDNLIDGNRDRVNTAHGWMAQLAPRTSDPGTSKATTLQAYSLNTGQTVPLGDFDSVLHTSETLPELEKNRREGLVLQKQARSNLRAALARADRASVV